MSPKAARPTPSERAEVLDNSPLQCAPENELGVVFLFAHLAKKRRLRIEQIRPGFPDCIAYQKASGHEKKIRIEFEYKSKSFKTHGHDPKACDWIVCWENNWPDAPKRLRIWELRREFGLGFNVWLMRVNDPYKEGLARYRSADWSVPSQAHKGDLILFYLTAPEQEIRYVYRMKERARKERAGWKPGMDYGAHVTRVCTLRSPIFLRDLKRHRVLSTAGFVRCQQGRPNLTSHWPDVYELIVERNRGLKKTLARYAPENLGWGAP